MTTATYADVEMSIAQMAEKWGVGEKTIENWTEFVYQAFGHSIPKRGAFYYVDTFLLDLVGMHVSKKASEFYRQTGESKRLKGSDFVEKVRGCFEARNFNKFSKIPGFLEILEILAQSRTVEDMPEADEDDSELDDTTYASMSAIVRSATSELSQIKQTILRHEDQELEEIADIIRNSQQRRMKKLAGLLNVTVEEVQNDSEVSQIATQLYKPLPFRR
jgi:DNA-binding transcriptional regulator YiaG